VCRRLPFDDGNVGRLFRAIKAGAFTLPTHLSGGARDLLRRMLTVDPLRRITIEEIRCLGCSGFSRYFQGFSTLQLTQTSESISKAAHVRRVPARTTGQGTPGIRVATGEVCGGGSEPPAATCPTSACVSSQGHNGRYC